MSKEAYLSEVRKDAPETRGHLQNPAPRVLLPPAKPHLLKFLAPPKIVPQVGDQTFNTRVFLEDISYPNNDTKMNDINTSLFLFNIFNKKSILCCFAEVVQITNKVLLQENAQGLQLSYQEFYLCAP